MKRSDESIAGKKVFVTGADGFIGSHLLEILVRQGANVRAMVCYNSWNERGWIRDVQADVLKDVEIFQADIRDAERVREGVRGSEYVFHLSSLIAIPYSYEASRSYVETNVIGALNLLQACRESSSLKRLLHVSTSEVYGTAQQVPIPESHPLVGQSPYAASKIGADKMVESFHRSFGLPVVTARPFNTYGPRQTARAVIPTIASQIAAGSQTIRLGALTPTRDFNYVTDTASGMLALATCREAEGLVVNIGSGEEWSIEQAAKILLEVSGRDVAIACDEQRVRPEKSEVSRLLADNRLIHSLTGWRSEVSFRQGLQQTLEWVQKNIQYFDADRYAR